MTQTASPYLSPDMLAMLYPRSPTNSTQLPNRREKRIIMMSDKLSDMIASFSGNNVDHYYAQLSAIQCDINLILRADPYNGGPLEDDHEVIAAEISTAREEVCRHRPITGEGEPSFGALSGRYYTRFVNDINTAMEDRDRDLTMEFVSCKLCMLRSQYLLRLHWQNKYQDGLEELRRTNQYKIQLAQEEHQLLSKTLRERLIQNVTQKRARLLRDKEHLDIADSNALLLNPNQFSLGHPASPGGTHNPRKTRHTRLRPGEVEEPSSSSVIESNKRKRKAAIDDNDSASPAPPARPVDANTASTFLDARAKSVYSQFEAPAYSIERLFSERELAMNMSRAHVATSDFFSRLRAQNVEAKTNGNTNISVTGPNNSNNELNDNEPGPSLGGHNFEAGEHEDDPMPLEISSLANLLPGPSAQTVHATRASHRANPLADLANTAIALAPYSINLSNTANKANNSAPAPPGVSEAEAQSDILLMQRGAGDPLYDHLTERCCEKLGPMGAGWWKTQAEGEHAEWSLGTAAQGIEGGQTLTGLNVTGTTIMKPDLGMGGVPMSKTSSVGGTSEVGRAVTMSRRVTAADFGPRVRRQ